MTKELGFVRWILRYLLLSLAAPLVFCAALMAGLLLVAPVDYEIAQRVAWFHYDRCSERAELWGPQFAAPVIVTAIFILYVIPYSRRARVWNHPILLAATGWVASILFGLWFLYQDLRMYCGPL